MNGFARTACLTTLLASGFLSGQPAAAAEETKTDYERRLEEPGVQQSILNVALTVMGAGHPDTREIARQSLRQRWWAFQEDIELSEEQLRAEEVAFERAFDAVAKLAEERSLRKLTVAGLDDVATPGCVRWTYVTLDARGPALIQIVLLRSDTGARFLRLETLTDLDDVEAAMNAIEIPCGEKNFHCNWTPPEKKAPTTDVTLAP